MVTKQFFLLIAISHSWCLQSIPKNLLDKHRIKMEPEMVLRNQEGKLWPVTVTFPQDGRITFSKGWMDFQKENGLGFDDKCIFEFAFHRGRRLSREIHVRILRATENKIPRYPTRWQLKMLRHGE